MTCTPGEDHVAPDTCQLCHEERETTLINVGDDLSAQLMAVCRQCQADKLLPPDW